MTPHSGKIMIRWGQEPDESAWFRQEERADYWDGEDLG
jgi:hypothetical protein